MIDYKIIPISEEYIEKFRNAVNKVAKEHKYLSFLEAPALEEAKVFVQENIKNKWPHYICLIGDVVVGWCDITSLHRPISAHAGVLGMGVISQYRGIGIGTTLIKVALNAAKTKGLTRIQLTVRETNYPAINLYKKFNFKQEGLHFKAIRIDNHYENNITMALVFE